MLSFTRDDFSKYKCSVCQHGHLKLSEEFFVESQVTKMLRGIPDWKPEFNNGLFHVVLVCTIETCKEKTVCLGEYSSKEEGFLIDGKFHQEEQPIFEPKFFFPNLVLFDIPKSIPKEILTILNESFGLFFCNPSSAANMVRIALEETLDRLKVRTYSSRTGKRKKLLLHQRLDYLPERYSEEKYLFEAIKWLGNTGSHEYAKLSHYDVEVCYAIFEKLLAKIFVKSDEKINRLARQINKRKGPIKSRKYLKIKP